MNCPNYQPAKKRQFFGTPCIWKSIEPIKWGNVFTNSWNNDNASSQNYRQKITNQNNQDEDAGSNK